MTEIFDSKKYLLVNPPIQDFRLPWGKWHLPMGLLQIASFLKKNGKDVKLIDALYHPGKRNIPKKKIGETRRGVYSLNLWQFGFKTFSPFRRSLHELHKEGWIPDKVFITSLNSIWWKSVVETIDVVKETFPKAQVVLGGAYPAYEYLHASIHSNSHIIFTKNLNHLSDYPPCLSMYRRHPPKSMGIYFYTRTEKSELTPRSVENLLEEINKQTSLGVSEFVFFDELFHTTDIEHLKEVLSEIAKKGYNAKFVFNGNIQPGDITGDFASLMQKANVHKIYFNSSIDFNNKKFYTDSLEEYEQAMGYLLKDGKFKARKGDQAAMLPIGFPFENLSHVAERLIYLSSLIGFVIPVPFQYVPALHNKFSFGKDTISDPNNLLLQFIETTKSPEALNGKLFPFAELSGYSFEEYIEIIRLSALLNSRYRSQTFDFLGSDITSSLLRESIRSNGWNPFST